MKLTCIHCPRIWKKYHIICWKMFGNQKYKQLHLSLFGAHTVQWNWSVWNIWSGHQRNCVLAGPCQRTGLPTGISLSFSTLGYISYQINLCRKVWTPPDKLPELLDLKFFLTLQRILPFGGKDNMLDFWHSCVTLSLTLDKFKKTNKFSIAKQRITFWLIKSYQYQNKK